MKASTIYLASSSCHKRRAVELALHHGNYTNRFRALPAVEKIISCACSTNIPKQPIGFENIRQACEERIEAVLHEVKDQKAVVVAIQNGIIGEGQYFYDTSQVMIRNYNNIRRCTFSVAIPVQSSYVGMIKEKKYQTTYGAVLANHFKKVDSGNLHKELTGIDRCVLLASAIEVVIGLFMHENLNIFEP